MGVRFHEVLITDLVGIKSSEQVRSWRCSVWKDLSLLVASYLFDDLGFVTPRMFLYLTSAELTFDSGIMKSSLNT